MKIRGLVGANVTFSFSEWIHEAINGIQYKLMSLDIQEFIRFMNAREFDAINITMPYKQAAMEYLDEVDPLVERLNSTNCIINRDGKLCGYNTDYFGFKYTIDKHQINIENQKVLVIGYGGASKAVNAVLEDYQAKSITFLTRSKRPETISYDDIDNYLDVDVIINASQMGMIHHDLTNKLDLSKFTQLKVVIDIVYNPLNTQLLQDARALEIKAVGGMEMLVAQAYQSACLFDDKEYDVAIIEDTYARILKENTNVLLIGMPYSGKTTIGLGIAERMQRELYDIDVMIEEEIGMSISDYFKNHDEEDFRIIETKMLKEIALINNAVIVTGGGIVTKEANHPYLRFNSLIVMINRPIDLIEPNDTRPLSKDKDMLHDLYQERRHIYEELMDYEVINDEDIDLTIEKVGMIYDNHI